MYEAGEHSHTHTFFIANFFPIFKNVCIFKMIFVKILCFFKQTIKRIQLLHVEHECLQLCLRVYNCIYINGLAGFIIACIDESSSTHICRVPFFLFSSKIFPNLRALQICLYKHTHTHTNK